MITFCLDDSFPFSLPKIPPQSFSLTFSLNRPLMEPEFTSHLQHINSTGGVLTMLHIVSWILPIPSTGGKAMSSPVLAKHGVTCGSGSLRLINLHPFLRDRLRALSPSTAVPASRPHESTNTWSVFIGHGEPSGRNKRQGHNLMPLSHIRCRFLPTQTPPKLQCSVSLSC